MSIQDILQFLKKLTSNKTFVIGFGAFGALLVLFGLFVLLNKPKQPITQTQKPVVTIKETGNKVAGAQTSATQESPTSQPETNSPAPTAPSAPQPTNKPSVAPSKKTSPVPAPTPTVPTPYQPPQPQPTAITNISLIGKIPCYYGANVVPYTYTFSGNLGGSIVSQWEYEVTEALSSGPPAFPPAPKFTTPYGSISYSDTVVFGLPIYASFGYRARLHATTTTDIYSPWVNVPRSNQTFPNCYGPFGPIF